jgi:zinc ribbon protein
MSSETSTESQPAFEPWQLFTLAGLIGATIAVFMARGESPAAVIMISLTIFAAAAVGIAALRTFLPLTQKSAAFGPRMLGGRTRAALDREKTLVLRSIKELEFDRAMGKVSEKDFLDMSGRLRARAARLMRQLDAGAGYRSEIEKEITKRIGEAPAQAPGGSTEQDPAYVAGTCASCGTGNDADARFCKHCGAAIGSRA